MTMLSSFGMVVVGMVVAGMVVVWMNSALYAAL